MKKQFEKITKEQQKLAAQLGTAGAILDSGAANASNAAPPAADLMKPGSFSAV